MELKVLVTGRNRKVARDICEHLEMERGYRTIKCAPSKTGLFDIMLSELPKVVLICLGDETADSIKVYDVLKNASKQGSCTTIVITNEEDEGMFMRHSRLERVYFISRPVSLFALYEKFNEIEERIRKEKEENLSAVREFVNENAEAENRRKHILVVDDDSEQLFHIKEQLEEFYDVTLVKSGEAAFKFLSKKIPDLILLDYLMPEKDGPQVLSEMRKTEAYAHIPVIFLTGVTERDSIIKVLSELKPQGYVVKPAKKSELVAKIIDAMESETWTTT